MRSLIPFILLSACTTNDGRAPIAADDALILPDAPGDAPPRNDPGTGVYREAYDATFTTPNGDITTHYVASTAFECHQEYSWELGFSVAEHELAKVRVQIDMPPWQGVEVSGPMTAHVSYGATTVPATLEATRIDYTWTGTPRLIGRLTVAGAIAADLDLAIYGLSTACLF